MMSSRRAAKETSAPRSDPIARRCVEILDQMVDQLLAAADWAAVGEERLKGLRGDLGKLVHWALHGHGDPDSISRIRDCYRRCGVDIDSTTVLRRARGAVKGVLRRAGVATEVPGLDPALDVATIILTTKRTIQKLDGRASTASALTAPSPALDRKAASTTSGVRAPAAPPPPPAAEEPPAPKPHTVKAERPPTSRVERRKPATPAEMQAAFNQVVAQAMEQIKRSGRSMELADYLAAIYNDDAKKAKLIEQVQALVPPVRAAVLIPAIDGCFRAAFRGVYIERTDRQGHRRAHRR
jgi:hypothetical protein